MMFSLKNRDLIETLERNQAASSKETCTTYYKYPVASEDVVVEARHPEPSAVPRMLPNRPRKRRFWCI